MNETATALRRAMIRIRYHGWRQGPPTKSPFSGYSLADAITGIGPGKRVLSEGELKALVAVEQVIGCNPVEWNDAPYRTKAEVLDALKNAMQGHKPEPLGVPSPCAERRMSEAEAQQAVAAAFGYSKEMMEAEGWAFPEEAAQGGAAPLPSTAELIEALEIDPEGGKT